MNKVDTFFMGVMTGIVIFGIFGILSGFKSQRESQSEAVAAGVAEWVIVTKESGEPEMKFQWKQTK